MISANDKSQVNLNWAKNTAASTEAAKAALRLLDQHIFVETGPRSRQEKKKKNTRNFLCILFTAKVNNKLVYEMQCNLLPNIFDLIKCVFVCIWSILRVVDATAIAVVCRCCARHRHCLSVYNRNNNLAYYNELRFCTYSIIIRTRVFFLFSIVHFIQIVKQINGAIVVVWLERIVGWNFSNIVHKYSWFSSNAHERTQYERVSPPPYISQHIVKRSSSLLAWSKWCCVFQIENEK